MGLTKQQLADRKTGIGASEAPAVAGLHPFAGPIDVYEAKVLGNEKEETLAMFLGTELEDPLAKLYQRDHPHLTLVRSGTLRHPKSKVVFATPDRAAFTGKVNKRHPPPIGTAERLVQFKTTGWRERESYGIPGTDQVPDDKLAQVSIEMAVTGVFTNDLAVLFDRDAFEVYTVNRDPEMEAGLIEVCERFWVDHIVPRKPPPPDASDRYREFLQKVFPRETKEVLAPATPEVEAWVAKWKVLDEAIKQGKEDLETLKNELRAFIGEGAGFQGAFGKVTWKKNKDSQKTDWEALARDVHSTFALAAGAFGNLEGDQRCLPLPAYIERHTQTTPGNRPLCKYDPPGSKAKKK